MCNTLAGERIYNEKEDTPFFSTPHDVVNCVQIAEDCLFKRIIYDGPVSCATIPPNKQLYARHYAYLSPKEPQNADR